MRSAGLEGVSPRKWTVTTRQDDAQGSAPDLVERKFEADAPNKLWVADITYVQTFSGWVYTAFVMDLFARRVLGWQVADHLRSDLALDALEMAIWVRRDGDLGAWSIILTGVSGADSTGRRNTPITEVCDGTGQADAAGACGCSAAVGGGSGVAAADAVTGPA